MVVVPERCRGGVEVASSVAARVRRSKFGRGSRRFRWAGGRLLVWQVRVDSGAGERQTGSSVSTAEAVGVVTMVSAVVDQRAPSHAANGGGGGGRRKQQTLEP